MKQNLKVSHLIEWLESKAEEQDFSKTCDTLKIGESERRVQKVAVAMFATPAVIKSAMEWGAEFMIVHEPLYYNHFDTHSDEKVETAKRALLEKSGMTVYRYHDHPHAAKQDMIAFGELKQMKLTGAVEYTDTFDLVRIALDQETTARELAQKLEETLNIKHIRIAGALDKPLKKISCMFGAPGNASQLNELKSDSCELLISGEVCEWSLCEYVRDASELGFTKAVFALGHAGSERDGMSCLAEQIKVQFPDVDVRYFECGEVYSYTD